MRVRRSRDVMLRFLERESWNVEALLAGRIEAARSWSLVARGTGEEVPVGEAELAVLAAVDLDWEEAEALAARSSVALDTVERLAEEGLLRVEGEGPPDAVELGWEPRSAAYHRATRWSGELAPFHLPLVPGHLQELDPTAGDGFAAAVRDHGPPPPPVHERTDVLARLPLPPVADPGAFYEVLRRRQVTRLFAAAETLPFSDLAAVLGWVWGARGRAEVGVTLLKKTSPSGGGLHPGECYPLVRRVEGLEPGLYHYVGGAHRLDLLEPMSEAEVAGRIEALTAGQRYFATSQVAFLLTARFPRTTWKYRHHAKAYRVVILDAGHLSQTLQLVAAERGLGAWVTAAINEADIDALLGLDGITEGALLVCGCGVPLREGPGMTLGWEPGEG